MCMMETDSHIHRFIITFIPRLSDQENFSSDSLFLWIFPDILPINIMYPLSPL